MHTHRTSSRGRAGVTLLELMVVIAILGILMSAVAVGVLPALDDARVATTRMTIQNVDQGLLRYGLTHGGRYPSGADGLAEAAPYVGKTTDAWERELLYDAPSAIEEGGRYDIVSLGRDGAQGGDGADADLSNWDADE